MTSPRDRAAQVTDFLTPVRAVMLFVDGLALLGAGFLVLDASALTLLERRRSLALLRALGARRRVIAIGLFGETALVGLVSAALGWLVGGVVARLVVAAIPSVVEGEFRFRFGFFAPWWVLPAALVLGGAVAVAASAGAVIGAARLSPLVAMQPVGVPRAPAPRRVTRSTGVPLLGGVATAAGVVVLLSVSVGPAVAVLTAALLLGGVITTFWALRDPVAWAMAALAARGRRASRLATAALRAAPQRVFAVLTAVTVATAIAVATTGITHATSARAETMFSSYDHSDLVAQTAPFGYYPWSQALPAKYVDRVVQLPSVRDVVIDRFLLVELHSEPTLVVALGRGSHDPIAALASRVARRALGHGGSAVVTRRFATTQHVGLHERIALPTPVGTRVVRIAGIATLVAGSTTGS